MDQRADLYRQIQGYMVENPPFIYLYELETAEAVLSHVQDYQPRSSESYFLKEVWLSDTAADDQ